MNKSVSVRINTRNNRTADFIKLVNDEGFDDKLRVATENRASIEAAELKKTLIPLVQISGHNVKWSAINREKGDAWTPLRYVSLFLPTIYIWYHITIYERFTTCNSTLLF